MCGVATLYNYHYASPAVDIPALGVLREELRHRGPDSQDVWVSDDSRIGLVHTRLSIIGPDERGRQPMTIDDQVVISFNGEIYNYESLRDRYLESSSLQSETDTEVVLRLYLLFGVDMLPMLDGMFSLLIWDARRDQLIAARDGYGVKPLYYLDNGWAFAASSEVRALESTGIELTLDPAGLVGFSIFGHVPEPFTSYREVRSLPPGTYITVGSLGASEPVEFADISSDLRRLDARDIAASENLREALLNSVRDHLVSDVPVSLFLSSGLDSAALLWAVKQLNRTEQLTALTLRFEEYENSLVDEAVIAGKIAEQSGVRHVPVTWSKADFLNHLPAMIAAMDMPTCDGLNTWMISRIAADHGFKVALSGIGGDELLGGYPAFRDVPRWKYQFGLLAHIPMLGRIAENLSGYLPAGLEKAPSLLRYADTTAGAYMVRRGIFMPHELKEFLPMELVREGMARLDPLGLMASKTVGFSSVESEVASLETQCYLRSQLLRDADWAGMSQGVEIRVPFAYPPLIQRAAPGIDLKGGKAENLLRAGIGLPREVTARSKTGFTLPMASWITSGNEHWSRTWVRQIVMKLLDDGSWKRELELELL
ncbi:MAG: asparagine synthase (glutamine-hydrolyzing) [Pseudomonadales bacterium]|nr:asparagine synthase (glutamine-hydrolyzing) [Pseudomonadales bacterium]MBO7004761.1 asparagine synthase (glutamine-hydrolyzing) [Pseudomonadales bacterium]